MVRKERFSSLRSLNLENHFRACSKSTTKRLRQTNQPYRLIRVCFYTDKRHT